MLRLMTERCPDCNGLYTLIGYRHRCIATDRKRLDTHVIAPSEYKDAPELTDEELARAAVRPRFDRKAYQREYMREYMRKRRAK